MGLIYMKDNPEAESFSYAYGEDSEGNLVRVARSNFRKALGIFDPIETEITLLANEWVLCDAGTYYTQPVTIEGTTRNSRVELLATPEQLVQIRNDELALFIGNNEGAIAAYCMNGTPSEDLTFEVRVTEVV